MDHMVARIGADLVDRITGPMHFRIVLQPAMAIIFATRDGWKDAKAGRPPYFWSLLWDPGHRAAMMHDGWHSIGKVFILASALDAIYQYIVRKFVYPGEMIIVAILLALVPYLALRGVVTRLAARHAG
jgi:hypothetical protein